MSVQFCPNCQQPLTEGAAYCRSCGIALADFTCPHCKKRVGKDDRFCEGCGARLSRSAAKQEQAKAKQSPSADQPVALSDRWRRFTNAWYGFTLDLPPGWFARTRAGVTLVAPDARGYVNVILRPLQVKKGTTAETLARSVTEVQRKAFPSFSAWRDPPLKGEQLSSQMLVVRYKGIYKHVPLEGVLVVHVKDELALVSGFQAPSAQIGKLSQQMQRIMTSLHFT